MTVVRFELGAPDTISTPLVPVITSGTDKFTFDINPRSWSDVFDGGSLKQVLSGKTRVTSTTIPARTITLEWQKLSAAQKNNLDNFLNRNTTLVLKDDTSTYYEVITVPGTYRANRRKSVKNELVSWEVNLQFSILS